MAAQIHDNDLRRCCAEVMDLYSKLDSMRNRYPDGMNSASILTEIRVLHGPDSFSLCSILDVHDEMEALYGAPAR